MCAAGDIGDLMHDRNIARNGMTTVRSRIINHKMVGSEA